MSKWKEVFNGKDLTGWKMRHTDREHKWVVHDGILDNTGSGVDIVTEEDFGDFELHIEYAVPADSNSGIYLRGRYEIQILDSLGREYSYPAENGALYNFKSVDLEASKPADEWQTVDVTLKGMTVSITLNGQKIHDNVELKNPTGGQLFDDNGPTGPLMLQGDHGPVQFRNIRVKEL